MRRVSESTRTVIGNEMNLGNRNDNKCIYSIYQNFCKTVAAARSQDNFLGVAIRLLR